MGKWLLENLMMIRIARYNSFDGFFYYSEEQPEAVVQVGSNNVAFFRKKDWDGKMRLVGYDVATGICISTLADMMGRDTIELAVKEIRRVQSMAMDLSEELEKRRKEVRGITPKRLNFILLKMTKIIKL